MSIRRPSNATGPRAGSRHAARLILVAVACALSLGLSAVAQAQGSRPEPEIMDPGMVQITGLYGVGFGGSLDVDGGSIDLDSGRSFTVGAGLRVQDDGFAFLSYSRQSTVARFDSDTGTPPDSSFDLEVGYLLIGGELDLPMNKHFVPFIGLGIGTTYFKVPNSGERPEWYFSGMAMGGLKIPIIKNVGLRTQVRFLGTVINGDASWFCGVNGGATCAINLGDSSGIIQGDVTGGLYVAF